MIEFLDLRAFHNEISEFNKILTYICIPLDVYYMKLVYIQWLLKNKYCVNEILTVRVHILINNCLYFMHFLEFFMVVVFIFIFIWICIFIFLECLHSIDVVPYGHILPGLPIS